MTTKQEFEEQVITMLSGNLVDVELTQADLDHAFLLAKKSYIQFGNNNTKRDFFSLAVTKDQDTYNVDNTVTQISNVIRPGTLGTDSSDPFYLSAFNMIFNYSGAGAGGMYIIYDLTMQLQETLKRYTIYDTEWVHNRYDNTIRFLKKPITDGNFILDCYHTPTDVELYDNLWVLKYTVAEAKIILGRAYRKFGSLPSPTGEQQIDGSELVQEGKEEKRELEDAVLDFQYGDPDGMGIYIG